MKDISIDSYDLVVSVALWGGFETGVWWPAITLVVWLMFYDYLMVKEAAARKYNIDINL